LTEKKRIELPIVEEEDEKDKSPGLEEREPEVEKLEVEKLEIQDPSQIGGAGENQDPSQSQSAGENQAGETEMVTTRVESETPASTDA